MCLNIDRIFPSRAASALGSSLSRVVDGRIFDAFRVADRPDVARTRQQLWSSYVAFRSGVRFRHLSPLPSVTHWPFAIGYICVVLRSVLSPVVHPLLRSGSTYFECRLVCWPESALEQFSEPNVDDMFDSSGAPGASTTTRTEPSFRWPL
jgi:hypothetical protein